eukprot:PhF_6_TR39018/c0_g1_i1/m.58396/K13291/TUT; terminal uridylyltransferase
MASPSMNWETVVTQSVDIHDDYLAHLGQKAEGTLLGLIDTKPSSVQRIVDIHHLVSQSLTDLARVHKARLYVFGSSVVYGFVEPASDIDMVFLSEKDLNQPPTLGDSSTPQARSDQNFVLSMIAKSLVAKKALKSVTEKPRARVPFVRCVTNEGQEVDISAHRRNGVRNTLLLQSYFSQPVVNGLSKWLALGVKVWAKRALLIDPAQAYLTSYAFNIMVVYYLLIRNQMRFIPPMSVVVNKKEPLLPVHSPLLTPLPHPEHLGFLFRDFLRFYNREFDFQNHVISLNKPGITTKQELGWTQGDEEKKRGFGGETFWYRLCIEDPYEDRLNLGRFVTPMRYGTFRLAMHDAMKNGLGYF